MPQLATFKKIDRQDSLSGPIVDPNDVYQETMNRRLETIFHQNPPMVLVPMDQMESNVLPVLRQISVAQYLSAAEVEAPVNLDKEFPYELPLSSPDKSPHPIFTELKSAAPAIMSTEDSTKEHSPKRDTQSPPSRNDSPNANTPKVAVSTTKQIFLTQNNFHIMPPTSRFGSPYTSNDKSRDFASGDFESRKRNSDHFESRNTNSTSPPLVTPSTGASFSADDEFTYDDDAKRKRLSSDDISKTLMREDLTERQRKRLKNNLACRKSRQRKQMQIKEVEKTTEELKQDLLIQKNTCNQYRAQLECMNKLLLSVLHEPTIDASVKEKIQTEMGRIAFL